MRYLRLLIIGIFSFAVALNAAAIRAMIAIFLCSLLSVCSSASVDFFMLSRMNPVQAAVPSDLEGQEIAVPPIIREAPIDLQNSIANDFVVSRQTPYDSGRNEVLIVSPSTGTEQRFEINLPTGDDFRLYEASFKKVRIDDVSEIVESSNPKKIEIALESFSMGFNNSNLLSEVALADGSRVKFSDSEVSIYAANGEKIEIIQSSLRGLSVDTSVSLSKSNYKLSESLLAQASSCESGIRNKIYAASQDVGRKANILRNANSLQGRAASWASAFGERALEDSLVSETRNQTLQEIACVPPIECDEQQDYQGASEIRTDLFKVSGATDQQVNIRYEFYDIPDRMEIYYQGELVDSIPRGQGQISNSGQLSVRLPGGAEFVGVKLIGNEDKGTRWNYTIQCVGSGESPCGDEDIQDEYDENDSRHHYYVTENKICLLTVSGCTREKVFEIMLSQISFVTPDAFDQRPVESCKKIVLSSGGGNNPIRTLVRANDFSITNYTLPGHIFHPGRVDRKVVQLNDSIAVRTIGEGIGSWRRLNNWIGADVWNRADARFGARVRLILDYENNR